MNNIAAGILAGVRSVTTDLHYHVNETHEGVGLHFDRQHVGVSVQVTQLPGNGTSIGITKLPVNRGQSGADTYVPTVSEAVRIILKMLED